ncbi:BLI-3 blue-light-inducible Bli-3 protein [Coniochaeta pulveracea]|uniref:BLI-3 blue-light-inducible Bli-3 protein n=1 Tax=Coniochaeta pulveracea TaxID=177199 RepID=A0A420YIJ3_9PEZI|nr:BLI-3 blue-light-inducible Bli-3 protein [Coniochaeta pulveracea]
MSGQQGFSNADTGSKPADPFKEKNLEDDISLETKIKDLSDFMQACKYGMMTTRDASSGNLVSRCMAIAAQEKAGIDLLFHTNTESHKTDELHNDPHINISFINAKGEWASINGIASVETGRELVRKYYSPDLKAWVGDLGDGKHDGGPEDPRIGIIRVKTVTATYNLANKNILSRAADVAVGTVTGKTAVTNKLREISEQEIKQWRSTH